MKDKRKKIILICLVLLLAVLVIGPKWLVSGTVPENIKVGVFYYPWYASGDEGGHKDWLSQVFRAKLDPTQTPALGQYSSQDPEVIGQHIQWSKEGNINVWITSWWGPDNYTDVTLKDHILPHPDSDQLEYAVLYESQGRLGSFEDPDYSNLYSDMAYLKETYFDHPNYLKIDGRPVVYIYLTREYFKGDKVEELRKLKEAYPDLYIIGDDLFTTVNTGAKSGLMDAVNNYDVYGQTFAGGGNGATTFELWKMATTYRFASLGGKLYGYDFIPSVAPSYNDRAVRDGHEAVPRYMGKNGAYGSVFEGALRKAAIPYLDKDTDGLLMVTSFNEWYEDTQIEPTGGDKEKTTLDTSDNKEYFTEGFTWEDYGNRYLEILAKVTGKK